MQSGAKFPEGLDCKSGGMTPAVESPAVSKSLLRTFRQDWSTAKQEMFATARWMSAQFDQWALQNPLCSSVSQCLNVQPSACVGSVVSVFAVSSLFAVVCNLVVFLLSLTTTLLWSVSVLLAYVFPVVSAAQALSIVLKSESHSSNINQVEARLDVYAWLKFLCLVITWAGVVEGPLSLLTTLGLWFWLGKIIFMMMILRQRTHEQGVCARLFTTLSNTLHPYQPFVTKCTGTIVSLHSHGLDRQAS